MIKKVLLFWLLIISVALQAQDYVITHQNDTIRGVVSISTYDIQDRLEIKNGKKKTHLTCIHVKLAVIKNEVYKPVGTDKGFRMMKLIKSGAASIYHGRSPSGFYEVVWIVLLNGSATEVPNLTYKKSMGMFLSDCQTIQQTIEDDNMTRKKLDQLIDEYNLCIQKQTEIANQDKPVIVIKDFLLSAASVLKGKLEASPHATSFKDAIDILTDIINKARNNQQIPNYLSGGLKDALSSYPEFNAEVENITTLIGKK